MIHTKSVLAAVCAVAGFAWMLTRASTDGDGPADRLNLILISLDTVRADRLSAYGYGVQTTPNLDELAQESVLFTDCLAQSTSTAPSHMSLFTGQYVHRHGLVTNHPSEGRVPPATLASVLKDEGWVTAAFTGHGSLNSELGHGVGFDSFVSEPEGEAASRNLPEVLPGVIEWLDERPEGAFFLFVHGYDPHCPYAPEPPWQPDLLVEGGDPQGLVGRCSIQDWSELLEGGALEPAEQNLLSALYDAELSAADAILGEFIQALRERALLDNSILVFTSDHGEVLGDRAWVGHTRLWEEELHVPLMIRFPEGRWSGRLADPVQLIDVAPTLLAALGQADIPGTQGLNLMPRVKGEAPESSEGRMRVAMIDHQFTVRIDDRYKLVQGIDEREAAQHLPSGPRLYDLAEDPRELTNLAKTPAGSRIYKKIIRQYQRWMTETGPEDALYLGKRRRVLEREEHLRMLESLGYATGDE